ncbi:MAG TPA: TPM domain-containing protein [Aromatoleum sp.]|uniref:TPM domain-containing protein n=1 Tax=Aromatoleum sp. TaxID=2307007 RepID=UPI002B46402E|nr:TPM domain-containing protein [Aromatoleum sp.]HJV24510.1 TPM domain-containing protein [Aromatoleum sp.]
MNPLLRIVRHLWLDADDAHRALGPGTLKRLEEQVRESEARHTGEICLCIEASLPVSYLWRHLRLGLPIDDVVHERALSVFGKLRVWDTELNNGVLIYLQLAERQVEIVADRGLARRISSDEWAAMLHGLEEDFRAGHHEAGLHRAIEAVGRCLATHFPGDAESRDKTRRDNQLPDEPVIR